MIVGMSYPATVQIETPDRIAFWRPLVQWLLAIPHLLVVGVLDSVSQLVAVISWFAILFTGKLPAGLADFQAMRIRYELRTQAYMGFLHDEYPPFAFDATNDEPGGTPVTAAFTPALEGRKRLTVLLRLIWMIPAAVFAVIIGIIQAVCMLLGFFAVLFTGRWPAGLQDFVISALRVATRLNAYGLLLTDEYPPFALD